MPCDQIRTQTVDMSKVDPQILAAAFNTAGGIRATHTKDQTGASRVYGQFGAVTAWWEAGKLTFQGSDASEFAGVQARITRAYTAEAFKSAAARTGFSVQANAQGQLVATRRRY